MSRLPFDQTKYDAARYEVLCTGYPNDGETRMGRAPETDGAEQMAAAFILAPGCKSIRIIDRENDNATLTIFTVERYKID